MNNLSVMGIKQLIYKETRNVLVANLVISCFLSWLTLPKQEILTLLGGPGSAGFGFYPASFLFSSSVTILLGKVLRKKVLAKELVVDMDVSGYQILKKLPRGLLARAVFIGLFCGLVIAPVSLLILNFTIRSEWTYLQAFVLNVAYLEALTLVVVPVVVCTALLGALRELSNN